MEGPSPPSSLSLLHVMYEVHYTAWNFIAALHIVKPEWWRQTIAIKVQDKICAISLYFERLLLRRRRRKKRRKISCILHEWSKFFKTIFKSTEWGKSLTLTSDTYLGSFYNNIKNIYLQFHRCRKQNSSEFSLFNAEGFLKKQKMQTEWYLMLLYGE